MVRLRTFAGIGTDSWCFDSSASSLTALSPSRFLSHSAPRARIVTGEHESPWSTVGVRPFVLDVLLVSFVGCVQESHNFRALDAADLRCLLQVPLRRREHGTDGSEPLEQAARERFADARQAFAHDPLRLFERHRLRLMPQAVFRRSLLLALPKDAQQERGLSLVRGREHGDPLRGLEDEERAQDRLRALVCRDLGQVSFEDHEWLRVGVAEPLDLLEEAFPDHRVEEIVEGLAFDADGSQDIVSRRDFLHLDLHTEFSEALRNVLGLVRIDDEWDSHGISNPPADVNVPVTLANQRR